MGEGGEHALFKNKNKVLLRIRKRDLVISAKWREQPNTVNNHTPSTITTATSSYLETVIVPCMNPYVDIPRVVTTTWSFLNELRLRTVAAGCIPIARRQDWTMTSSSKKHSTSRPLATILYDYRFLHTKNTLQLPKLVPNQCWSVELKPKAGYMAFSPLVQHKIKYSYSRFVLLQQLHQRGIIAKGWTSSLIPTMSAYDPMDLYSASPSRMKTAVDNLFQCPQNNLRVHYNETPLIGLGAKDEDAFENICQSEVFTTLFGDITGVETTRAMWRDCLVAILQEESILKKLLGLQELDVLDADGAILVYRRLVELCNGSHEQAQSLLDHDITISTSTTTSSSSSSSNMNKEKESLMPRKLSLLESSPFAFPDNKASSTRISAMCDDIADFRQLLIAAAPSLPQESDEFHDRVRAQIDLLNVAECRFLLWNWLLSLTMCDVSIFISLQQIEPPMNAFVSGTNRYGGNNSTTVVSPMSSNGDPGHVTYSWNDEKQISFLYSVRLIDCDGKPSRKLRSRQEKEAAFEALV